MPRGRFAPSPTGRLHFGSLVAALGSWLHARSSGGTWIVRMEDLDGPREVPGAGADILATLCAFGMESDEPVVLQSQRTELYAQAFRRLHERGLVYPCHCSRSDLAAWDGIHPRACVKTPSDGLAAPAWRLRVGHAVVLVDDRLYGRFSQELAGEVGDFVLRRADGSYTYQLAVVVDDAAQRISEVVRGADLLDSTPRQVFLQRQLGLPTPAYVHLPLALDPAGRKLSKQDRSRPVDAADPLPALRAALAFLGQAVPGGSSVERFLREATAGFVVDAIPRQHHLHVAMRKD
ncbi:MAG TPA: tRNA glutamyl-Q(34) synthetase GluQRS [Dokdonella sp.]|nr:tRNA glutamyl-Q(34) synthetase GluQRS [Dokdonella sp.]